VTITTSLVVFDQQNLDGMSPGPVINVRPFSASTDVINSESL